MDPKRAHDKRKSSGAGSSSGGSSPASPSSSPAASASGVANVFANDGSFMEIFKKKMEEEKRKREAQQTDGETRAAEQGQTSVEKKALPVTSFVRGSAVVSSDSSSSTHPG